VSQRRDAHEEDLTGRHDPTARYQSIATGPGFQDVGILAGVRETRGDVVVGTVVRLGVLQSDHVGG
jgi:hypothetical protein